MSTVSSKLAFRFSAVTWPRNNPEKYLIEAWSDLTSLKRTQTSIWLWYITATVIKLPSFVCSYKLLEIWVITLYFSFTKSELFCYITIWKHSFKWFILNLHTIEWWLWQTRITQIILAFVASSWVAKFVILAYFWIDLQDCHGFESMSMQFSAL